VALSDKKVTTIQVEYESGIDTLKKIAKRYNVTKMTIIRLAKNLHWVRGKNNQDIIKNVTQNVTKSIVQNVTAKQDAEKARLLVSQQNVTRNVTKNIIERGTNKLIDYSNVHLKYIRTLRTLSAFNTSDLVNEAKEKENLSSIDRTEAERILAIQRVLELSMKTHDLAYKSERLAMGIKDSETTPVNINIGKVEDLDSLSNDELDLILSEVN